MLARTVFVGVLLFPHLLLARTTKDVRITFESCAITTHESFPLKIGNVDGTANWQAGTTWIVDLRGGFVDIDEKSLDSMLEIPSLTGVIECCRQHRSWPTGPYTSALEFIIRCDSTPERHVRVDADSQRQFSYARVHPGVLKSDKCNVIEGQVASGQTIPGFLQKDLLVLTLKSASGKPVAEFEVKPEELKTKNGRPFSPDEIKAAAINYKRKLPNSPQRILAPAAGDAFVTNEDLPHSIIVRQP